MNDTNKESDPRAGATATLRKKIGMPTALLLSEFGSFIWSAFGSPPYHVGSSLESSGRDWRDVDVRLMLDHDRYCAVLNLNTGERAELDRRRVSAEEAKFWNEHVIESWCAFVTIFSEYGKRITGLPIDFQIQHQDIGNLLYGGQYRSALGMVGYRIIKSHHEH